LTNANFDQLRHITTSNSQNNLGKPAPEGKTILDFNEAKDDGVAMASAGPYANHLHLALDGKQWAGDSPV